MRETERERERERESDNHNARALRSSSTSALKSATTFGNTTLLVPKTSMASWFATRYHGTLPIHNVTVFSESFRYRSSSPHEIFREEHPEKVLPLDPCIKQ